MRPGCCGPPHARMLSTCSPWRPCFTAGWTRRRCARGRADRRCTASVDATYSGRQPVAPKQRRRLACRLVSEPGPLGYYGQASFEVTAGLVNVPGDAAHRDSRGDDDVSELGKQVITRTAGTLPAVHPVDAQERLGYFADLLRQLQQPHLDGNVPVMGVQLTDLIPHAFSSASLPPALRINTPDSPPLRNASRLTAPGAGSAVSPAARGGVFCLLALAVVSEVGQDGEGPAVGVVGLREAALEQDVSDVLAHGCLGDDELPGDRGVRVPFGHEGEDLALTRGQCGQRVAAAAQQPADDLRVDDGPAGGHAAQRA